MKSMPLRPLDGPLVATEPARVEEVTRDHLIARWGSVVLLVWKQETTLAGVKKVQSVYEQVARDYPKNVFLLTVVEHGAPMPAAPTRDALASFLASCTGQMVLSAVVHEGTGFRAAAVRSVVTGLALMANLPYPHKVFATVEDACRWLHMHSPVGKRWESGALVEAVREVRERTANA